MRAAALGLAAVLWCGLGAAESLPGSASARAHFEAGLTAVARGELEEGLREFEAAYAIQPRYSVLFNIGQAQAALGRPLDAIASFERFLSLGGSQIREARRHVVTRLIEQNRRRTGTLLIEVRAPDVTRVWIDGEPLPSSALGEPRRVVIGRHTLLYSYGSGFPTEQHVQVEPEQTTEVVIAAPPPEPRPSDAAPAVAGAIAIACQRPGLQVQVAGKHAGRTPLPHAISAGPGEVRVTFERAGYEPVSRDISVLPGGTSRVGCALPLVPTAASLARDRAISRRRVLGFSLAGAGLASLGASAAIYGWNQGRYADWEARRTAAHPMTDRAVSIQRADDAAVGLLILGAGLSALATWTLLAVD